MFKRIVKYGALAIAVAAVVVGVLFAFFGLKVEMDGTGWKPIFSFEKRDSHYAEIERLSEADRSKPTPLASPMPAKLDLGEEAASPKAELGSAAPASAPWPAFYGPTRDGKYTETAVLTAWPETGLKQVWRRPVGGGYASMVVAEGKVFTIEQRRDKEAAVAYELGSGREVWVNTWKGDFKESMGGDGPRATPAYDGGRVYSLGAEGELRSIEAATGKTVWRVNILEDNGAGNLTWGMAAAPLVDGEQVIVMPGKGVAAYDKSTGKRLWRALEENASYTAAMMATLGGERQIIAVTADRACGLTPAGKLLWSYPWRTEYEINAALPLILDAKRVLLTAGYGHGSALIEVAKQGAEWGVKEIWKSQAMKAKFNNVVVEKGVVYGLDEGIMAAMDVETGRRLWKGGRYGYGQLLLASGHLIVTTESGDVVLVKADPKAHTEIASFPALDGKTWNVPAMAHGYLLVRNATEMACFRIAP